MPTRCETTTAAGYGAQPAASTKRSIVDRERPVRADRRGDAGRPAARAAARPPAARGIRSTNARRRPRAPASISSGVAECGGRVVVPRRRAGPAEPCRAAGRGRGARAGRGRPRASAARPRRTGARAPRPRRPRTPPRRTGRSGRTTSAVIRATTRRRSSRRTGTSVLPKSKLTACRPRRGPGPDDRRRPSSAGHARRAEVAERTVGAGHHVGRGLEGAGPDPGRRQRDLLAAPGQALDRRPSPGRRPRSRGSGAGPRRAAGRSSPRSPSRRSSAGASRARAGGPWPGRGRRSTCSR